MDRDPAPGQIWKHYKGGAYQVMGVGKYEPTLQPVVVYRTVGRGDIWVRPLDVFLGVTGSADANMPVNRFERVRSPK